MQKLRFKFQSLMFLSSMLLPIAFSQIVSAQQLTVFENATQPSFVAVVHGATVGGKSSSARRYARGVARRLAGWLNDLGIPCAQFDDTELSVERLRPYSVIVLPYNKLHSNAVRVLERFVKRGGHIIAVYTTASKRFYNLMGVRVKGLVKPSFKGQFSSIALSARAQESLPGLPQRVVQNSWLSFRIEPLLGTQVLGWWEGDGKRTLPAITWNRSGAFIGHILTEHDGMRKAMLLACLILNRYLSDREVEILRQAFNARAQQLSHRYADALKRLQVEKLTDEQRQSIERALAPLRTWQRIRYGEPAHDWYAGVRWLRALVELRNMEECLTNAFIASQRQRDGELRGIWFFRSSPTDWDEVMRRLKAHGLNAIFMRVGRGGNVIYKSEYLPSDAWVRKLKHDEVQRAIETAHRYGIQFHAWRVCFHMGSAPKWYRRRLRRQGRLVQGYNGRWGRWANPNDPRNRELEVNVIRELVEKYDVDGVHLDYIRFPEVPHYHYDYSERSRKWFEAATGMHLMKFPDDALWTFYRLAYDDWQRNNVTELVRRIYKSVKEIKPWVKVSAAVWPNPRYHYATIKQDWLRWAREGILDFVVPMNYTASNERLMRYTAEQICAVGGSIPIAIGLGVWLLDKPKQLVQQVATVRELGADGFVLFSYNVATLEEFLSALSRSATAKATYPGYESPNVKFAVRDAVARRDAPYAAVVGQRVVLNVTVNAQHAYRTPVVQWQAALQLVDKNETLITQLGTLSHAQPQWHGTFAVRNGWQRPVVQGTCKLADGNIRSFVRRGPWIEGMREEAFNEMIATQRPPVFDATHSLTRVGIYADGAMAHCIMEALKRNAGNIQMALVGRIEPSFLHTIDCLIIPPFKDMTALTFEHASFLRHWVKRGKRVILLGHAVGYGIYPALFPEVGRGIKRVNNAALRTSLLYLPFDEQMLSEHPLLEHKRGKVSGIIIRAPIDAHILARFVPDESQAKRQGGQPAIVGKAFGKGYVVLCGVTYDINAWQDSDAPAKLLNALIQHAIDEAPVKRDSARRELTLWHITCAFLQWLQRALPFGKNA